MQGDAVDYVARLAVESPGAVDLAIIDVFDGMDITPPAVSSPGADVSLTSFHSIRRLVSALGFQAVLMQSSAHPGLSCENRLLAAAWQWCTYGMLASTRPRSAIA